MKLLTGMHRTNMYVEAKQTSRFLRLAHNTQLTELWGWLAPYCNLASVKFTTLRITYKPRGETSSSETIATHKETPVVNNCELECNTKSTLRALLTPNSVFKVNILQEGQSIYIYVLSTTNTRLARNPGFIRPVLDSWYAGGYITCKVTSWHLEGEMSMV